MQKTKRFKLMFAVILFSLLFTQILSAQNILMTGWTTSIPGPSLDDMANYIANLGYTVTRSNNYPGSLAGYDILILLGGGSDDANIPDADVDNFVNAGNGLILFEGIVEAGDFNTTANSNPVTDHVGWDLREDATVINPGHTICSGLPTNCTFEGYSTNPVMKAGADVIMLWDDLTVFAATYTWGSGLVVYINNLHAWYVYYWRGDVTNGEILLANALDYVNPFTGIDKNLSVSQIDNFELFQNYPNPFNASTVIPYYLPSQSKVTIQIINIEGRIIRVIEKDTNVSAGKHLAHWDGTDYKGFPVSSGVYIYQVKANSFIKKGKMIITK